MHRIEFLNNLNVSQHRPMFVNKLNGVAEDSIIIWLKVPKTGRPDKHYLIGDVMVNIYKVMYQLTQLHNSNIFEK